jgi:hypothetical protein
MHASQLAQGSGQVRCGQCSKSFNALEFLFDHRPSTKTEPLNSPKDAETPVVGLIEPEVAAYLPDDEAPVERLTDPNRPAWLAIFWLLLIITLANIFWTFREPLLNDPHIRTYLDDFNVLELPGIEPFQDLGRLHLVSRDMHPHPTRSGMLIMSFTFVNRAHMMQPFPNVELIIRNSANELLAVREFTAAEYLSEYALQSKGLAPNVHLPVFLEFANPGETATGFELNFRKAAPSKTVADRKSSN